MDQIIFCDIDGCLVAGKHVPFDLSALAQVRHLVADLAERNIGFCLSTGRPQPYAEAMGQVLGLTTPFICENGAFVFHPKYDMPIYKVPDSKRGQLQKLQTLLSEAKYTIEMGNEGSLSVSWQGMWDMAPAEIAAHREMLNQRYRAFGFNWTNSSTSIDILVSGHSKRTAAAFILERYGLGADNAYAIGDSENDREILDYVRVPMCPANATHAIKAQCDVIAGKPVAAGVVDLLRNVLEMVNA